MVPGTSHESASPLSRPDGDLNTTTNANSEFADGDILEDGFEDADIDGVRDWNETDPARSRIVLDNCDELGVRIVWMDEDPDYEGEVPSPA